jgi:hypothetical protein
VVTRSARSWIASCRKGEGGSGEAGTGGDPTKNNDLGLRQVHGFDPAHAGDSQISVSFSLGAGSPQGSHEFPRRGDLIGSDGGASFPCSPSDDTIQQQTGARMQIGSHRDSDPDGLSAAAFFGIANTGGLMCVETKSMRHALVVGMLSTSSNRKPGSPGAMRTSPLSVKTHVAGRPRHPAAARIASTARGRSSAARSGSTWPPLRTLRSTVEAGVVQCLAEIAIAEIRQMLRKKADGESRPACLRHYRCCCRRACKEFPPPHRVSSLSRVYRVPGTCTRDSGSPRNDL